MSQLRKLSPLDPEAGARLVGAAGADEFGAALLDIASSTAGVNELFGYIVLDDHEPEVLLSESMLPGVKERVDLYVRRFYHHDPAVLAIRKIKAGDSFVQRISLSNIIPHDYRKRCFTEPGFAEKLSFGWRGERYLLVISFYGADAPDNEALAKLANLASMTLAVLVRQHAPIDRSNAADVIEGRLRRSFPTLSNREAQVCALTILGWTSPMIADRIGVAPGTILTYRQRAYQKTGVTAAAELIAAILN